MANARCVAHGCESCRAFLRRLNGAGFAPLAPGAIRQIRQWSSRCAYSPPGVGRGCSSGLRLGADRLATLWRQRSQALAHRRHCRLPQKPWGYGDRRVDSPAKVEATAAPPPTAARRRAEARGSAARNSPPVSPKEPLPRPQPRGTTGTGTAAAAACGSHLATAASRPPDPIAVEGEVRTRAASPCPPLPPAPRSMGSAPDGTHRPQAATSPKT